MMISGNKANNKYKHDIAAKVNIIRGKLSADKQSMFSFQFVFMVGFLSRDVYIFFNILRLH